VPAVRQKLHLSSCADFRGRLTRDNPIVNKDPDGNQFCEAACADLVVYPIAASYAPAIWTGIGAAATYITADMALRNSWDSRWGGTVPILDPSKMGFGPPPMGPEDWRPNLNGKQPEWMKTAVKIGLGLTALDELS
jgi:hypothetical protein